MTEEGSLSNVHQQAPQGAGQFSHAPGSHESGAESWGRLVVVTGMSGAGKTMALKAFEDMGYEAVDNLPLVLLGGLIGSGEEVARRPIAIGIDIRTRDFNVARLLGTINALADARHLEVEVVFVDADDEALTLRYTETRRRHPIGGDLPLHDGIAMERRMLASLRDRADVVIDTTGMTGAALKQMLEVRYATAASPGLSVFVTSFGFRNGLPREADLVFDVRFLRNPHYVPALKPLTGCDAEVAEYVAADPDYDSFFNSVTALLGPLLPRYEVEGKSYLTVAIGCTGGRHRSVFVVEQLAAWFRTQGRRATVWHRDTPGAKASRSADGTMDNALAEAKDATTARQETTGGQR